MTPNQPLWLRAALLSVLAILLCACSNTPVRPTGPADFQHFIVNGNHQYTLRNFELQLRRSRVDHVIPTYQLLRQGTDWRNNRLPQYAFPAAADWPKMIRTLKFMRRFVIPAIGPVEVVSGFRTPTYNLAAGGAARSKHLSFSALDVKPRSAISRQQLHKRLLKIWHTHGKGLHMGLGLYSGNRFHIDTAGHRKW